jgi:hypothetical protein
MRDGWENFKLGATGRWSISFIGFLLTVPFGALVSIERELTFDPDGGLYRAFLITCAGYFVTFLYVFTLQATILRNRVQKPVPIFKCILIWYSAGLVYGISTATYAKFAFASDWWIFERTAMPTLYIGAALALTAYFLGTIGRLREENRAFNNLESLLLSDSKGLTLSEDESYQNATTVYATLVRPEVKKISTVLYTLEDQVTYAHLRSQIVRLQDQSQELKRILDHRIGLQLSKARDPLDSWNLRNNQVSLFSEILPRHISVRLSFFVIVLGAVTGQFPRNGIPGVIAGLTGALFIGIGLFVLSKFYKKSFVQRHLSLRFLFFFLAFAVQVFWTFIQPYVGFDLNDPYNPLYSGAKTIYGVYVASIIASLIVMNAEQKGIHFERSRRLLAEFERRKGEIEVSEERMLEIRYGTLLGKLGSVSLAMNLLETSEEIGHKSLDIEAVLREASELLDESILILEGMPDVSA